MIMTNEEARQLLLDAGVPEEVIDEYAIDIAAAIGDGIAKACAEKLAMQFVENVLPLIRDGERSREKWAELGIISPD